MSDLLDAKGAAQLLNVPSSWVLAEARANRIPHIRLGRYVRFEADELVEWYRARLRGPRRAKSAAGQSRMREHDKRPRTADTAGGMAPGG